MGIASEPVELFFEQFYRLCAKTDDPIGAFAEAQRAVREAFPAHRDWAAFHLGACGA